jgi:hypothetical protein
MTLQSGGERGAAERMGRPSHEVWLMDAGISQLFSCQHLFESDLAISCATHRD